jgi:hypothetical protein
MVKAKRWGLPADLVDEDDERWEVVDDRIHYYFTQRRSDVKEKVWTLLTTS